MKKLISLSLAVVIALGANTMTFADTVVNNDVSVLYTNTNTPITFKSDVLNVDGTNFFPMRELLNNLGIDDSQINWNSETKQVNFSNDFYNNTFTINDDMYSKNDFSYEMPVEPFIYENKTYLPIRYIAESIGLTVGYDEGLKQILITGYEAPVTPVDQIAKNESDLPQFSEIAENEVIATMHTTMGDISLRFFPDYAPLAVENFLTLAESGYYDNVTFHRVINDFMIQGGDPEGTGMGGESAFGEEFKNEVTPLLRHFPGALSMANAGPDTNGSQFFIVEADSIDENYVNDVVYLQTHPTEKIESASVVDFYPPAVTEKYLEIGGTPFLDFNYSVFGQVISGMDVVHKIAEVETNEADKPLNDVIINSIEISNYTK